MQKNEFFRLVAYEAHVPPELAKHILETAFDVIQKEVAHGGRVQILGFGTFKATQYKARNVLNPRTGKPMHVRKFKTPSFTASKSFKAAVKS